MIGIVFLATSLYAIIGGPSVGKTSILEELKSKGQHTIEEAATVIIKKNFKNGIKNPWEKEGFQADIFALQLELENKAMKSSKQEFFVDRGILDNLVYLEINGKKNTKEYKNIKNKIQAMNIANHYKAIFYVEPYSKDKFKTSTTEIRHENTEEALKIANAIKKAYSKYYTIYTIPGDLSPKARAALIEKTIKKLKKQNFQTKGSTL